MRIIEYKCDDINDGKDIKYILKMHFHLSSSLISRLKSSNGIFLNNKTATVRQICHSEDVLKLIIPYCDNSHILSSDKKCEVLYEDDDIICINKPGNMPSHPSAGHHSDTLANCALNYLRKNCDEFHIVTRLDRYTSGVLLAAKNAFSASKMCIKEYTSSIHKVYVGICRGELPAMEGIIEAPIGRCRDSVLKRCVSAEGKFAKTEYKVLSRDSEGNSRVRFVLHTGRTHQIRVHAAFLGNPLVNDFLYDEAACENSFFSLHCRQLKFVHPYSGELITVKADFPTDFYSTNRTLQ